MDHLYDHTAHSHTLFCSHVYPDRPLMLEAALDMATRIAKLSPVAMTGTKLNLNYSRDHSVDEGLEYMVSVEFTVIRLDKLYRPRLEQGLQRC